MKITCDNCGSDRFAAGVIEPNPAGGFDVFMPCAQCGQPKHALHEYDPELAQELVKFFGVEEAG